MKTCDSIAISYPAVNFTYQYLSFICFTRKAIRCVSDKDNDKNPIGVIGSCTRFKGLSEAI